MAKRSHSSISIDTSEDGDSRNLEIIAPDGDVLFVLGSGETLVQVNSVVMKTASPVIAAILEERFPEGHKSDPDCRKPVEVILGGDDPKSFISICRILHFQRELRNVVPAVLDLLKILRVSDKYDVRPAISFCVEVWIRGHVAAVNRKAHTSTSTYFAEADNLVKDTRELDERAGYDLKTNELFQLLVLCYHSGDNAYFKTISKRLIREHIGSFITLAAAMKADTLKIVKTDALYKIAGALQEEQDRILFRFFINLHNNMFTWIKATEAVSISIDAYVDALEKYGISNIFMPGHLNIERPYSISEVCYCVHGLRPAHFAGCNEHEALLICSRLNSIFRKVERVEGICLLCLHEGLTECMGKHDEPKSEANRE
ncbi:hypothetical protein EDB81DRAFT_907879 [Dactylonectria macrodidyma]|uniref:BTB domain-containing protein n=1 Tax=Dactylonectria macrodidyma TaxID=307937 RepID=A0A9P9DYU7_9HYPO|nr:hypothetical protein EDB81DRAFT_907879 [Dactylonectria macrodidyma]